MNNRKTECYYCGYKDIIDNMIEAPLSNKVFCAMGCFEAYAGADKYDVDLY